MPLLLFSFGLQLHDALTILTWTKNKSTSQHLQCIQYMYYYLYPLSQVCGRQPEPRGGGARLVRRAQGSRAVRGAGVAAAVLPGQAPQHLQQVRRRQT